jgi:hypothetical protein
MIDTKSILSSKGVWGGIIAVLAALAGVFGFNVSTEDTSAIVSHLDGIIAAAGGLLAIYGRIAATKKIG